MHPWGIKVSIIEPGAFKTQMGDARDIERQLIQGWNNLSVELKREYGHEYLENGKKSLRPSLQVESTFSYFCS